MALWLCIIAIVISILVGWKYKLNTGIIAMACLCDRYLRDGHEGIGCH